MNDTLNAEAGNMEQRQADGCLERAEIEARQICFVRQCELRRLNRDSQAEERAREIAKREMCFVRESVLRRLNRIPRRGSDQRFRDPVTGLPNDNVHEPLPGPGHYTTMEASFQLCSPREREREREHRVRTRWSLSRGPQRVP